MKAQNGKSPIPCKTDGFDRRFLEHAIRLGREAGERGEVPVGAVIVRNGEIIAEGSNHREEKQSALSHAEIEAIAAACEKLHRWRLDDCTLYVTLEPCPMCAGAILNARIATVVFGAYDLRAGSMESVVDLCRYPFESHPTVYGGICEDECAALMTEFFKNLRK